MKWKEPRYGSVIDLLTGLSEMPDHSLWRRPTVIRRFLPSCSSLSTFVQEIQFKRKWRHAAADPTVIYPFLGKGTQKCYGLVFY